MNKKYSQAIVGGTFDRFHVGHKKLLDSAFAESENVTIGVSTEKLYRKKFLANTIEEYTKREAYIKDYIRKHNADNRTSLVAIEDIYGTTLKQKDIDVIFITEENSQAADLINQKRSEIGFSPLEIIIVPYVTGNDGQVISSERIRRGEIDRVGTSYQDIFRDKSLTLPHRLRVLLRNPIDNVIQNIEDLFEGKENIPMIIAVGDIVALSLFERGRQADVSVVDFKTRRHELKDTEEVSLHALNPTFSSKNAAGKIENEAALLLGKSIDSFLQSGEKQTLKIIGEEDLLALPAILLAPLQSLVVYGLYDQGAVIVEVTEEKKQEIVEIVKKFEEN
jgi:pantetheine-phosphate adenylyltransferase